MNELMINGSQKFMGNKIPVISGGFGIGKRCMSDKTIADIHGMQAKHVRARITDNLKRFKENVDFIDLKQRDCETGTLELLQNIGYAKQSVTQAEHIYLLSERGYAKLIKIMDTDLAWEIHDKLIDEYFELKEDSINRQQLSPQMQLMNMLVESMSKNELEQKRQAEKLVQLDDKVTSIKEVVALNPTQWRKDSSSIINKIAKDLGGYEHIKPIRDEIYRLLEHRMGVALIFAL
ncbi:ORF6N domain-containing protein [Robinsoniella peoriensis]|uniref:ORF6N domain-containing protein n=1 Tax=Robinsoniella peoriensis TaxID=180332 RepID=UPI000693248F|nr:ORF6N domain-containing protein [Robinsoniella peoriensis]